MLETELYHVERKYDFGQSREVLMRCCNLMADGAAGSHGPVPHKPVNGELTMLVNLSAVLTWIKLQN